MQFLPVIECRDQEREIFDLRVDVGIHNILLALGLVQVLIDILVLLNICLDSSLSLGGFLFWSRLDLLVLNQ